MSYRQGAPPPYNPEYNPTAPSAHQLSNPPSYQATYQPPAGIPHGISPELWNYFQAVDQDRSGKISVYELQKALLNGNWTPFNDETCRLMIGMFDRDKSGEIDVYEFGALWKYIDDWRNCFQRYDTDRSGNISAQELHNAFNQFGYRLSFQFSQLCVRVFDRDKKNSINFDDFIQCCVMLKSLTDKFRLKDSHQQGHIRIHYEEFLKMVLETS